ncbi:DUF6907 domain-containing protein [Streptomyces sp. NPDC059708]|uniref:DUF6907 domain-containing protein n=1 Tax=Streptomyces sp. NPDC059708 TaxID=3346916 RepID=UPI0036C00934
MTTVLPEPPVVSVPSPTTPPAPAVSHPTACPSWCKDRHAPLGHHFGPSSTAHWSPQYVVWGEGSELILRAELVRLDGGDRRGEETLFVSGETDVELTAAEADVFILQAQAWVDTLRVLRRQMS